MGRPNTAVVISDADREQLSAMARSRSMPHSLVRRAQIVLLSGEGQSNREVARRRGSPLQRSATGAADTRNGGWPDCTTNCVRGARAPTTTSRWRS